LCWTEKADDYSAPRRASASVCIKTDNPARRPAESSIIAYFSRQRYHKQAHGDSPMARSAVLDDTAIFPFRKEKPSPA
jgi:hypothetical protein